MSIIDKTKEILERHYYHIEENTREIDVITDNLHSDLKVSVIDKLFSLMQLVKDNNKVFQQIFDCNDEE